MCRDGLTPRDATFIAVDAAYDALEITTEGTGS